MSEATDGNASRSLRESTRFASLSPMSEATDGNASRSLRESARFASLSPEDEVAGGNAARCLLFPLMFFVSFMVAAMVYNAWFGE